MTVSPSPDLDGLLNWLRRATADEREIEAADAIESAQSEIARLTTVSGDMVEEMARAIAAAEWSRPRRRTEQHDGDSAERYAERAWGLWTGHAQAAATIAKGRIAELEAALRPFAISPDDRGMYALPYNTELYDNARAAFGRYIAHELASRLIGRSGIKALLIAIGTGTA